MTVLSAIRAACGMGIALEKPTSVYGSAVREHVELADLANDVALEIFKANEWRKLRLLATITGDGTDTSFALPADYDRMLVDAQLWSTLIDGPLVHVKDADAWLSAITNEYEFMTNAWTLYGGQVHFLPALDTSEVVRYWYMSNLIVLDADTTFKAAFDDDTDTFRLDERLLKLGIIWRWREMKGLPYAENLANYELLKEKRISADGGPAILTDSRATVRGMGTIAYPWTIPQ